MSKEFEEPPFKMTPVVFHVLLSLADGEAHAYGIMKDVEERTGGRVKLAPGSLHYTVSKLLGAGMIEEPDERPDVPDDDGRRIYYALTGYGRQVLAAQATLMAELVEFARARDLIVES